MQEFVSSQATLSQTIRKILLDPKYGKGLQGCQKGSLASPIGKLQGMVLDEEGEAAIQVQVGKTRRLEI